MLIEFKSNDFSVQQNGEMEWDLIDRKRKDTSLMTIALSVMETNIFGTFKLAVEVTRKKMRSQARK